MDEDINVLKSIIVKFPERLHTNKIGEEITLFEALLWLKSNLVTGITNKNGIDDLTSYVYGHICPRLQIHDLVVNEKVASVKYRRFSLTKQGQKLLAYIEKKKLIDK